MFSGHSWHGSLKDCVFCMKCATKSPLFALFSGHIRQLYHARGGLCKPGSGRGYPQKYSPGTKSHFFWMRLNSEKLKNLRKTKKARPESGVWWGRVPLLGKVGRMGESLDHDHSKTGNKKAAHNGRLEPRKVTKFCYSCSHKI